MNNLTQLINILKMKSLILSVFLFLISAQVYSQIVGIRLSPSLTLTDKDGGIGGGLSTGFFYDQKIYKRIGLSTGINYTEFRAAKMPYFCFACGGCPCPERVDNKFGVLEIPIDLRINTNRNINASKWGLWFNFGYSYGRLISKNAIIYDEGKVSKYDITYLHGLHKSLHIAKIGFEVSREIASKFSIDFGGMYKYVGIYDEVYGGFSNWNLFIKTGYNLARINKK